MLLNFNLQKWSTAFTGTFKTNFFIIANKGPTNGGEKTPNSTSLTETFKVDYH